MVFRRFFSSAAKTPPAIPCPVAVELPAVCPVQDTAQTRRAARDDLLTGIGVATEANLSLGAILRDAFGLVSDMAAFSTDFESTADLTRTQVERSVASVDELQRQSDHIEMRLRGTSMAVTQAHTQSKAALGSVADLTQSIDEIERVIHMIATIASQTNLLALNATIEAARAGSAGAGFGIVASEVKALSQATQRAANEIVASVNSIRERAEVNRTNVAGFDETVRSIEHLFDEMNASVRKQTEQTRDIGDGSGELVRLAHSVRAKAGQMRNLGVTAKQMTDLADGAVTQARRAFAALIDRAGIVLAHSDVDADETTRAWPVMLPGRLRSDDQVYDVRVIDISPNAVQIETGQNILKDRLGASVEIEVAGIGAFAIRLLAATPSGYYTTLVNPAPLILERIDKKIDALRRQYEPYIARVREVAKDVGALMDRALDAGTISETDLFDTVYRRDGLNEPAQYMNAAVLPLEKILRSKIEDQLTRSPRPDFCFVQDRNGFAAIHNLRFSHLSRPGDVLYNLRHARTRRIFDDRVGMSASRNLRPYLVQSYARDMGDRVDLRMEFDAPVFARGRHWGSVRMAYELADATSASQIVPSRPRTREAQAARDNVAEIA